MNAPAETPQSDRRLYAARPTIVVGGRRFQRSSEMLQAMRMRENEGGMSSLELRYSNLASHPDGKASLAFEDERQLELGAEVSVYGGDEDRPTEVFRGKITAIEVEFSQSNPPELVVLAEDQLLASRMERRTHLHEGTTLRSVAQTVATRAGLQLRVSGFTESIGTYLQLNESDLAFLRRLLRDYDGDMQVVGDTLHVATKNSVQRESVTLRLFSQLLSARLTADLAHQVTEVTVAGWDPELAQRVSHVSQGRALGPGAGRTGAQVLQEAFGRRSEHLGCTPVLDAGEAEARAHTSFDQRARRFVVAECTANGNPSIRVGAHVTLAGVSPRFDNTYYVFDVCHRFDLRAGYFTDFQAECAYFGAPR
ncbi:MAG: contractile injection system protein, VgrG/Pvc8 family [Myxococcota bacterium]